MESKINDVLKNLEEYLNVSNIYTPLEISINKLEKDSINDLKTNLNDINNISRQIPKVWKLKTINFDSLIDDKRLTDINLSKKKTFFQNFLLWLKWRVYLSWKPVPFFNKRVFFSKNFLKNLWIIFVIFFFFWVIDKFIIENKINFWYKKIISIKENPWNIEFISKSVNDARLDFIFWDFLFKPFLLIPNKSIENWYYILSWGKNLTKLLDEWIQTYITTKIFIDSKWWIANVELTNLLINLRPYFSKFTSLLYDTIIIYNKIGVLSDKDLNNKLLLAKDKLKESYKFMDIINRDFDVFLSLLWNNLEKKYLIIFQNNDEIRPTWWFMWSIATVTIKNGKVTNFVNDDIYAYEWEVNKVFTKKDPAPEWLNRIAKTFWLRDSNYYIDFESSSHSINFFLNKINKKVDWIIFINQKTILDFLKYTWPINFEKIWEDITEENFSLLISTLVEAQSFKTWTLWTPKQILFDFANIFISILKEKKDYFAYLDIIKKNIKTRDLVIYSFNPEENNLLWQLWLNWKIDYSNTLDFSYPVYTSIGWNKSDRYIELKYSKNIIKNEDCSIDTDLKINRKHLFSNNEEQKIINILNNYPIKDKKINDLINIQWKWENKSYVRVILPKDAIVQEKDWMNIIKQEEYTILEFYMDTKILESTQYNINYKIPNIECNKYSFKFYKQPGINKYNLEIIDWDKNIEKTLITGDYIYKN